MNESVDVAKLLEVEHLTRYRYAAPVDVAHHLGFLRPLDDGRQQVTSFEMVVEPEPSHRHSEPDRLGNRRTCFTVTQPHRELQVRTTSRVQVHAEPAVDATLTPPWERVRDRLRYIAGAPFQAASEFVFASPYVTDVPGLRELALPAFAPDTPIAQGAIDLMARIHSGFTYRSASTEVDTPLVEVLATRRGVCQDFAHVMIGALRSLGLAARYVSGYLLTAPSGAAAQAVPMLGADASHAWLALWCPMTDGSSARWFELDPTNNLLPTTSHVRLAIGRDYGDVTPLRGVIRGGGGEHQLDVRVRTRQQV